MEPREIAERLEQHAELPKGKEEQFAGYAVMGLPFASGHVLGLRHFPASSLGPGYTSVWHRNPGGRWVFCQGTGLLWRSGLRWTTHPLCKIGTRIYSMPMGSRAIRWATP